MIYYQFINLILSMSTKMPSSRSGTVINWPTGPDPYLIQDYGSKDPDPK